MPRGDRSGPTGAGPMTGRGLGYCAGYPEPGYTAEGYGMGRGPAGFGRRGGGGRGWRHRYYATGLPRWARGAAPAYPQPYGYDDPPAPGPREQSAALKSQVEYLESALEEARARLAELEPGDDE